MLNEERLLNLYSDTQPGSTPTQLQWQRVLNLPSNEPLTLVNFFKFRARAEYHNSEAHQGLSGEEAFNKYAEVSVPCMQQAGGSFLFLGNYKGDFIGEEEPWDMIVVGQYPTLENFKALYSDDAYIAAFRHRTAACKKTESVARRLAFVR